MRVDNPANARRMGFNAEPAPGPWSPLIIMNTVGGEHASAFRVIQSGIWRPWSPEGYRMVGDVDERCMQGGCDQAGRGLEVRRWGMSSHLGHTSPVESGRLSGFAPQAV